MKEYQFASGRGSVTVPLDESAVLAVLHGNDAPAMQDIRAGLLESLAHPIGSKPLCEEIPAGASVALVVSDLSRFWMRQDLVIPHLVEYLHTACGVDYGKLTIVVANGTHTGGDEQELRTLVTSNVFDKVRVENHDCEAKDLVYLGTTAHDTPVWLNKTVATADFVVCLGACTHHIMAGFGGGRKSILPGICNAATVNENHSYKAVSNPHAAAGVLEGNPIHEDMLCAAKAVHVQFILNVALDAQKKIIAAWAGDLEKAHAEGVKFVRSLAQCPVVEGDIVVTSNGGYPLDQNLYQSPKAVATAEACCREGGVIIMCCSCADGMGGSNFERLITMGSVDEIDAYLSKIPPKESISEQWCAQIYSRILKHHKVILVTTFLDHELVRKANMIPASDVNEALEMALEMMGKNAQVVVIPDGVAVLAVKG